MAVFGSGVWSFSSIHLKNPDRISGLAKQNCDTGIRGFGPGVKPMMIPGAATRHEQEQARKKRETEEPFHGLTTQDAIVFCRVMFHGTTLMSYRRNVTLYRRYVCVQVDFPPIRYKIHGIGKQIVNNLLEFPRVRPVRFTKTIYIS
jgi:hypothetical protein